MFTVITVAIILAVLAVNYLLMHLISKNALYIDMTPETLYTLSDEMKSECAFINELDGDAGIEVIFCQDPDKLTENTVTRVPYFMALQMQRHFDNFSVRTENVTYNPTALAKYKTTSLTEIAPSDIIISYGNTYRIVSAESFWMTTSQNTYFSYNGEYKMASILMSVTAVNKPVAYFTVGHGETYYDINNPESAESIASAGIYDLLTERGLKVLTLDLSKQEIPEDCALLIINNPKEDFKYDKSEAASLFYVSETKKIDRYLRKNQGALMVARDYMSEGLTNLDAFLGEWGFAFGSSQVSDSKNHVGGASDTDRVIGAYETESNSYANAIYGEFANLPTAPNTIFLNTGYVECSFYETDTRKEEGATATTITYNSFIKTHETAVATTPDGMLDRKDEALDLAAVSVRHTLNEITSEAEYSYVFCANSADFLGNELLYSNTYANFDIVSAVVNNISRTDIYASMELGGSSMNSPKYGGKQLVYDTLSETSATIYNPDATFKGTLKPLTAGVKRVAVIISVTVPLVPLCACIVIKVKRKYL